MLPDLERMAQDVIEATKGFVSRAMAPLRAQVDGATAAVTALEQRVSAIPQPKEFDYETVFARIDKRIDEAVAAIPAPQKGDKGDKGESVHQDTVELMLVKEVERALSLWPRPKNGEPGKDGLGFDDLSVEYDGRRAFSVKFQRGEEIKAFSFTLPVILDAGVFRRGTDYEKGDSVTWDGSMWIAQRDTGDKPGESDAWRLSAKRGRDGKDFTAGKAEPPQVVRLR